MPSKPRIITTVGEMQALALETRGHGRSIALVPTMGFLHEGHAALLDAGRQLADTLILSIFVNPTQFGPGEDLDRYPRNFQRDLEIAEAHAVDMVFAPSAEEMYGDREGTFVEVPEITNGLCGAARPGHFRGVATVVTKLFNITLPTHAVFGEKDFQQLAAIRKMVRDLNLPVEITGHPIVREHDGLAMSSRNAYLSPAQRAEALSLRRGLLAVRQAWEQGERDALALAHLAQEEVGKADGVVLEYAEIVDARTLESVTHCQRPVVLALAARVGSTRLIDNMVLSEAQASDSAAA